MSPREYLIDDVRAILREEIDGRTPPPASSETMRVIAGDVFDSRVPQHVLTCPIGARVERWGKMTERARGAIWIVGIIVTLLSGMVGGSLLWALDRTTSQVDKLRDAIQDVRLLVERGHRAEESHRQPAIAAVKVLEP
jgi:hypothetical protein